MATFALLSDVVKDYQGMGRIVNFKRKQGRGDEKQLNT
jgi:hypothetical protein